MLRWEIQLQQQVMMNLFYLAQHKSFTYIISTSLETGVISKDLKVDKVVLLSQAWGTNIVSFHFFRLSILVYSRIQLCFWNIPTINQFFCNVHNDVLLSKQFCSSSVTFFKLEILCLVVDYSAWMEICIFDMLDNIRYHEKCYRWTASTASSVLFVLYYPFSDVKRGF